MAFKEICGLKEYCKHEVLEHTIELAVEIAREGREGRKIGTLFIVSDENETLKRSKNLILDPLYGHPKEAKKICDPNVRETIKELAQLDGAFIISGNGIVEAAGRHLDAVTTVTRQLKGLGSRHRAAASITMHSEAVAVVVSESTGRVTIFDNGGVVATLEPVISRRVV